MNIYLAAAVFSGLFYAVSAVIYKGGNKHLIKDPLRYVWLLSVFKLPFLFFLLPFVRLPKEVDLIFIFSVFLYSSAFFLGSLLVGIAIVHLDASVFQPLFNLQIIFTPLIAFFFLNERFSPVSYLLMGVVLLGGILITFSERSQRRKAFVLTFIRKFIKRDFEPSVVKSVAESTNLWLVLLILAIGLIFYSLSDNLSGLALRKTNVFSLVFFSSLLYTAFSLFLIPFFGPKENVSLRRTWPIFVGAVFSFLGLVAINIGFSYNVSLTQVLSRLSTVYTLIIVIFLAKFKGEFLENHPPYVYMVRFLGAGVMVLSAIALVLLK